MSKVTVVSRPNRITIASKGVQGAVGPEGPEGIQGIQGEKGDTGDVTPEALAARDAAQVAASAAAQSAADAAAAFPGLDARVTELEENPAFPDAPDDGGAYIRVNGAWVQLYAPLALSGDLPDGTVDEPYTATLEASGGRPPYTLGDVLLPPGLDATLADSTVTVAGTPTEEWEGEAHIDLSDSLGTAIRRVLEVSVIDPNALFEADPQPSFNILDTDALWDGIGRGIDEFISEMFDPLIASGAGYVTRSVLGRDSSDTYDIIEYDFNPPGATQTILLSFGTHGRETVPVYSAYRLAHYLINNPDVHPKIRALRDTVRIKMLPSVGIWAGSQSPKVYSNANDLSSQANAPVYREYQELVGSISGRGPSPLSETEAEIRIDWFKANAQASFYADWHTDYSWYGQVPSKDVWLIGSDEDPFMLSTLAPIAQALGVRAAAIRGEPAVVLIEGSTSTVRTYATEVLGIPAFTHEYCETRFGGRFGGSEDVTNHLTAMVNLLFTAVRADLRAKVNASKQSVGANAIANFHFPPANIVNDRVNINWSLPTLYSKLDSFVAANAGYVTQQVIGQDSTGTYPIKAITLDPGAATKTICLVGGVDSPTGVETVWAFRVAQMLAEEASAFGLAELREQVRLILIPTINPWGYNANAVDLETVVLSRGNAATGAIAKSELNSAGERPGRVVGPGATVPEAAALTAFLQSSVPTSATVIGLGSGTGFGIIVSVRRHNSANPAVSDLAYSLGQTVLDSSRPMSSTTPTIGMNVNAQTNAGFTDGLQALGYPNAAFMKLTPQGFRRFGENMNGGRATSSAMIAYLLDLMKGVSQL